MTVMKSMPDFAAPAKAMMTLADTAFGFVTKLNVLGMETACSMAKVTAGSLAESCGEAMQSMVAVPALEAKAPAMERTMSYIRSVGDLSSQSQSEIAQLVESYVDQMTDLVTATIDEVAEAAPLAAPAAVAAMKNAVTEAGAVGKGIVESARKLPQSMLNAMAAGESAKSTGIAKAADKPVRKAA